MRFFFVLEFVIATMNYSFILFSYTLNTTPQNKTTIPLCIIKLVKSLVDDDLVNQLQIAQIKLKRFVRIKNSSQSEMIKRFISKNGRLWSMYSNNFLSVTSYLWGLSTSYQSFDRISIIVNVVKPNRNGTKLMIRIT